MRTQWRMAIGMSGGQRLGIDYTSLYGHPKFARLGFNEQDRLLGQIQHIEAGALAAMNEQSHLAEHEAEDSHRVTMAILDRQIADQEALLGRISRARDFTPDGRFLA